MEYAPLSDVSKQDNINTENQLTYFSDSRWQDCPETDRSRVEYIIFYQGGKIEYGINVPWPVSKSSAETDYNRTCTAGVNLSHFRMLIHELYNKDTYIAPKEYSLTILNIKYAMCMDKNGKDTKHTRNIARRVHFVRNGEKWKMHNIDWC